MKWHRNCAGAYINKHDDTGYILTPAHCVENKTADLLRVS